MSDSLLDIPTAADRLGVSERRLPFVKVGRFVRFRPADLDRYIDRQLVPAGGKAA